MKFLRVTEFRVSNENNLLGSENAGCFVKSKQEYVEALRLLEDLSNCLELKVEFPLENALVDCIQYGGLIEEVEDANASKLGDVEKIVKIYLAYPLPEIRERILRKVYQKLRISSTTAASQNVNFSMEGDKPKAMNNNVYIARFLLRKGILNHLVNGILINKEIAEFEESKLQMSLGQLIVKMIILAFNEIQGDTSSLQARAAAEQREKSHGLPQVQQLNQFLLTFQCLLAQYPELISLVELIEEAGQRNCRYLRILRDLFQSQDHKREFATNVLRASFAVDCSDENVQDVLKSITDLRQPSQKVAQDLELINSGYDYSTFAIMDIVNILQSSQQDYSIKKSSLEQLTMILFDVQAKRGRLLFDGHQGIQDVFTYVVDEIIAAYNTSKNCLKKKVGQLGRDQVLFVNECLRFAFYSYLFFNTEEVIQGFFNKVKNMISNKKAALVEFDENGEVIIPKFEQLLNALVFFAGSLTLRENSLLLLYVSVYQQLWICTKIQKQQLASGQIAKNLSVLIPDFCQDSII